MLSTKMVDMDGSWTGCCNHLTKRFVSLFIYLYLFVYLFIYDLFKMFSVMHIMLLKGRLIGLLTEAHSSCVCRIAVTASVM